MVPTIFTSRFVTPVLSTGWFGDRRAMGGGGRGGGDRPGRHPRMSEVWGVALSIVALVRRGRGQGARWQVTAAREDLRRTVICHCWSEIGRLREQVLDVRGDEGLLLQKHHDPHYTHAVTGRQSTTGRPTQLRLTRAADHARQLGPNLTTRLSIRPELLCASRGCESRACLVQDATRTRRARSSRTSRGGSSA